ncbi:MULTISPECIES: hypothetical protein [Streptomyces]|uniref:Lipoprotein n=1 Tax=Streptomyces lycii TaxID=2654337 RepID=A0ABQ7FFZ2_9ACTN|nr:MULTISPECIES: hypothetical protein [Streptomyces]KAF4406178.1 hypothetical protein GCU69_26370 [Streptomyces lycii]PGH48252.1 hypothetical protein CRI70_24230 [Streptomyces sp. Ru87]
MKKTLSAAAAGACAAVLLTACGSGESGDSGKIEGADSSPSASASASSPGRDRPKIELPEDIQLVFEDTKTGDPVKDAVLADSAERIRAMDAAIVNADPDSPAVLFYSHRVAQASAQKSIKWYKDEGYSLTGTFRYYDREVSFDDDKTAVVTYCGDESKGFAKERDSGKVLKTPVRKTSYVRYVARQKKNADGVWQTSHMRTERGAEACQP